MLKSGYKYKYNAVNQERLFNSLCLKYNFFNLKKEKTCGEFCLSIKQSNLFEKEVAQLPFEIKEKKGFGLLYHLTDFLKRFGIIAGFVLASVFIIASSFFVFKIDIIGNEIIGREHIVEILNDNGINAVNLKSNIDCKKLEKDLITKLSNVSLVSIIIKGNTLVVSIKEKVNNAEFENKENFKPIVSEFDGVITSVNLIQGSLLVKVGDIVKKGDILVSNIIRDSSGNERQINPKAEIYAKVYVCEKQSFFDFELKSTFTGKTETINSIYAFGIKIYSDVKECSFEKFESEKTVVAVSQNNILPIYRERIVYNEIETNMVENDFEQKKLEILTNLKQKALEKITEYDIIENERQNIVSAGGKNTVELVLELNKRIC